MSAPTVTYLPELIQGTDEWFDQRRGIVTASTVGQLISQRSLTAIDFDCPACDAPANDPCRSKVKSGAPIKTLHPERAEVARMDSSVVLEPARGDVARTLTLALVGERLSGNTDPSYTSYDMQRGIDDEPRARDIYAEHFAPVREVGFIIREHDGTKIGYSPDGLVGDDVRCGPAGKPAPEGSPLSDGHKHARAIRITAKAILRDLWIESRGLYELENGK